MRTGGSLLRHSRSRFLGRRVVPLVPPTCARPFGTTAGLGAATLITERTMQLAAWTTGSDSIGWSSLPHDSRWCITPPPFGQQCTLLRPVAMAACLAMPRCVALTCPDPTESQIGRKVGVTGPICQARSIRTANEKHHGMCRPGGLYHVPYSVPIPPCYVPMPTYYDDRRRPRGAHLLISLLQAGRLHEHHLAATQPSWCATGAEPGDARHAVRRTGQRVARLRGIREREPNRDAACAAPASRVAGGELGLEFASGEAGCNTALRDRSGHGLPGGGWDSAARGRRPAHKRAAARGTAAQLHVIRPRPPDKGVREREGRTAGARLERVKLCGLACA